PNLALDEFELQRYLTSASGLPRRTQRVRASALRKFRRGYPKLFPVLLAGDPYPPPLEPITDAQFETVMAVARTFRSPAMREFMSAMLLMGRGAGADGADMRYVSGRDVFRLPRAGVWIRISRPGHERQVPILRSLAPELLGLAEQAGERSLLTDGPAPCYADRAAQLSHILTERVVIRRSGFRVSPERLRAAWITEQLLAEVPLKLLLQSTGLRSLSTVSRLF
ncbi:MAG: hypothetical protein WA751_03555, partial [Candidatus Dormiibacterota bacterium]